MDSNSKYFQVHPAVPTFSSLPLIDTYAVSNLGVLHNAVFVVIHCSKWGMDLVNENMSLSLGKTEFLI